jgi:hypothetical protein
VEMSAPPRKPGTSKAGASRPARSRARAKRQVAPKRPKAATRPELVAKPTGLARHHREAEEAITAFAVGAALIGPFLVAGAIGLRVLRRIARHGR